LDGIFVYLVALVILITASAFFSGSEAALFTLKHSQIRRLEKQSFAGRRISSLLAAPRKLLITILIGNLVVNVFSTSAATSISIRAFGNQGIVIAFVFMSVLILLFGEILPKALALNRPARFSQLTIYPLSVFHVLFYPIRLPINRLTDSVIDFLKKRLGLARTHFSQGELLTALDIGHDAGQVGDFQFHLLSNIIEFRDTVVKEIMTASINVFSLPMDMSREQMEDRIVHSEFSRVPVYGQTADDIKGIVHIKELAAASLQGPDFDIGEILRAPFYVPESTRIAELFKDLGRQRVQLAVVIDEYGSYVGIVTMEDILEELVGEIRDSKEPQTEDYTLLDNRRIVVLGTMEIDRFNGVFEARIIDEDHETMAGYVMGATGRIPHEGESIDVEGLRFHIISAQPNRIRKMRVEKL